MGQLPVHNVKKFSNMGYQAKSIEQNLPKGFKGIYEDFRGILAVKESKCAMPKN